jgi:hypothetical protein
MLTGCEKRSNNWTCLCSDFEINYDQGSGWTGQIFSTTISYPDSLIIYTRKFIPIYKERTSRYHIDKKEIDTLFLYLQKLININLTNYGFGPNKPTDYPVTFFKYRNCTCTDSASIYFPDENEVPDELYAIFGRIDKIIIMHDTLINIK